MSTAFLKVLKDSPEFLEVARGIENNLLPQGVLGLSHVNKAHYISSLCEFLSRKALVLTPDEATATKLANDINSFGGNALIYPQRDFLFRESQGQSREYEQRRISVLNKMLSGKYTAVVCSAPAAVQRTIPPKELKNNTLVIKKDGVLKLDDAVRILTACGYERSEMVEGIGQFAVRGGILDFFPTDSEYPVRAELWGDTVDTLCYFDVESQRRIEHIKQIRLTPSTEALVPANADFSLLISELYSTVKGKGSVKARENLQSDIDRLNNGVKVSSVDKYIPLIYNEFSTVFDYLPKDGMLFVSESAAVSEHLKNSEKLLLEDIKAGFEDSILCKGLDRFALTTEETYKVFSDSGATYFDNFARGSFDTPVKNLTTINAIQTAPWNGQISVLLEDIPSPVEKRSVYVVSTGTFKAAQSIANDLNKENVSAFAFKKIPDEFPKGAVSVIVGSFSNGENLASLRFNLISYGRGAAATASKRNKNRHFSDSIHSLDELHRGDYVVHSTHGIGIFDGIQKLQMGNIIKDYIKILYAKNDVLYVPVTQLDLVSKYINARSENDKPVKLNRMGSHDWENTRKRVSKAVQDMADQLIKLYSERMNEPGHAFSPDIDMQSDFERRFPYDETEDQLRAVDEIKRDMERPHPMDRLLCGDVGFGKTEVALRAAFKCIADGKQCAILVPTTILAFQHYQTIMNRFGGFPIEAEMLSRFRTPAQQEKIIKRLKHGSIDIIVGTHRLISNDVKFRDLGLVIVDEEQRFGVAQKEKLKELFPTVDVLTLSATPIPRTLNMAMSGIRDMSTIEEAPQDRRPVQTYVLEHDMGVLCEAMEKELRRGGQVYYLHNRVETIEKTAAKIREFLPEAKIEVAHGKMTEEKLSSIWERLTNGEIDILVCTTIIETGVDVPNVNTLIIEDADRLGLAQLHQIRGRVGRSARRAFAYFTFTRGKELSEIATRRLNAIREFTEFGSGFKIAMRDLEIRGAGNILGAQQHGYMAAVGYDMYIQLLNEAVGKKKGEKIKNEKECLIDLQIDAHIPESYISSIPQRLSVYRRIADIRSEEDRLDCIDELEDRFGKIPESVMGLMDVSLLRNTASENGIYEIGQKGEVIYLYMREIDTSVALNLSAALRSRVNVVFTGKSCISARKLPNQSSLETLKEIFSYIKKEGDK
ncbi:MAG: transcription-repair coupling factor [Ruminococcaceae bacterium]|nr:transcription-repair coupling factor [Oscillospiraceae bacterium]